MEEKKKAGQNPAELSDEQMDKVSGGVINVFDAPLRNIVWWDYTCRACGNVACVYTADGEEFLACGKCGSLNIEKKIRPTK